MKLLFQAFFAVAGFAVAAMLASPSALAAGADAAGKTGQSYKFDVAKVKELATQGYR